MRSSSNNDNSVILFGNHAGNIVPARPPNFAERSRMSNVIVFCAKQKTDLLTEQVTLIMDKDNLVIFEC